MMTIERLSIKEPKERVGTMSSSWIYVVTKPSWSLQIESEIYLEGQKSDVE